MRRKILIPALALAAAAAAAAAATAAETVAYSYDARGRLVQVTRAGNPAAASGQPVVTAYAHDKADNRIAKTTSGSANPPPP